MTDRRLSRRRRVVALFLVLVFRLALPHTSDAAATIVIVNSDGAGEGFNDPTPVAPVGGNPGTTLGAQRLNAAQHAANIWGAELNSAVPTYVRMFFNPLTCTAFAAVLGSAGPVSVWRDFTGAPLAGHWYHAALANKLVGTDLLTAAQDPNNHFEINATFNSNLGQSGCLTGTFFYYGLDNNHGTSIDLVTVLVHEFGHGLGFSTTTNGSTGALLGGFPSAYDRFVLDTTTSLLWDQMLTNAERAASAIRARKVVWNGAVVTSLAPLVLQPGTPEMVVSSPSSVAGTYLVGSASFGPPLSAAGVTGDVMPLTGVAGSNQILGCEFLSAANALAVNNNIALIDRGVCAFTMKVKNAQNAGAKAVVIANDVAGSPPPGMGGADPTIAIPAVQITRTDGNTLRDALRFRSRTRSGVVTRLTLNLLMRSGADVLGRVLLFTPDPFQGGSSVSHWDTIATPNLLMEPFLNDDLTHSVTTPVDLTLQVLHDLGW